MDHNAFGRLADDVDQQHQAAMTGLLRRRQFLKRAGIGGAVVAVGASTASVAGLLSNASAQTASTEELDDGDLGLVQYLQTIELAAARVYETAIGTRKLDAVYEEASRSFSQHHVDYAAALATLAAKSALDEANSTLVSSVTPALSAATSSDAVLASLFQLERSCAATYQLALASIESADVAAVLSTIQPIEGEMTTAWGQVLELPIEQWMPAFVTDAEAYQPAQYAV